VLTYAQWINDEARLEVMRTRRRAGHPALEGAVPGIEPSDPVTYRVYRSIARH
jgi:hypothetical protein